ncbi:MAG: alkaline phosphatase D family protein, partial [Actinomycetota bacterium]|nr:alkaline phosphatase D family protein [Actinomycetota bacterium]
MSTTIDRRRFLTVLGGATAGLAATGRLASPAAAQAAPDPGPFGLGVASGDPYHDSVVLWTRLGPDPRTEPVTIRWELADDERFAKVRQSGTVVARPEDAHAVHVEVADLPPGRWFFYRFVADGEASRVGRTRTMPAPGSREPLRLAVASCQAWVGGPYPAYRDLAEQAPDLVFHLGDYIYETSKGSLEEFRRLHALYKSSPELRDAHAAAPFIVTWDDHEVQNNYAAGIAGGAGDGRPFLERRANAYQAFYEHLPLRRSAMPQGPDALIYRRFSWGKVAEFSVLDGRQYRSDQPCGDPFIGPVCGDEKDPARTMLGPAQEQWLLDGLRASKARWNVLAQQTIMAPYDYDVGPGESRALDAWDGYPAARERILATFAEGQIANPLVLAGDWHSTWVNDLEREGKLVATEFAGTSISSGCGWDATVRLGLPANPQVRFYEGAYRGYLLCTVSEEEWRTDMRIVLDARDATSPAYTLAAFAVADGRPGARRLDAGTGIRATVRVKADGAALPNAQLEVRDGAGKLVISRLTDANGDATVFAPPGTYALTLLAVGFEAAQTSATVADGRQTAVEVSLDAVTLAARTGRRLPGALAEAALTDIVLENGLVAVAISTGSEDSQLAPTTKGKPRDLAGRGFVDQLDWLNMPYASTNQPLGGNAWQQRTVRHTDVAITGPGTVRCTGASTQVIGLTAVTTWSLAAGADALRVETTFTNTTAAPVTAWVG